MSDARALQRAIERGHVGDMCAAAGPAWGLFATFEALGPDDDTMGTDEVPAFLESYERAAPAGAW